MGTRLLKASLKLGIYRHLRRANTFLRHRREHRNAIEFYSRIFPSGSLVFDVGANRGQSSEVFMRAGARVIAFEPQMELHQEIRQLCHGLGELGIDPPAVSDRPGSRLFHVKERNEESSLRKDWEGVEVDSISVPVTTLDLAIERYGIPFYIKIDVEGHETEVLKGLSHAINVVSFEYHLAEEEHAHARDALGHMAKKGEYECNILVAGQSHFALPHALPLVEFRSRFPHGLGFSRYPVFGEIFLTRMA